MNNLEEITEVINDLLEEIVLAVNNTVQKLELLQLGDCEEEKC